MAFSGSGAAERDLSGADEEQIRMMDERVIVTDYFDRVIGNGSKKESKLLACFCVLLWRFSL